MRRVIQLFQLYPIALRYGLFEIFLQQRKQSLPWLKKLNPWKKQHTEESQGVRFRLALEAAGPLYVKFGQVLSTRRDLLPPDIIAELTKLQDQVAPFDSHTARNIVEASLGEKIENLFAEFSDTPIGSASIAQVHGAVLPNGEKVVVKILRPNIEKNLFENIEVLALITRLLETFSPTLKNLRIHGVVDEFKLITQKELDLNYEAANASQLKRNMQDLEWMLIPQVYWPYVRKNVAVFERIHATSIGDKSALIAQGFDLSKLAQCTIELFFTAVFEHNFFHADMHPGNIFITEKNGQLNYILVDFGIMGTLHMSDQQYLAENLLAFLDRDYQRVTQLHIASGWIPRDTRPDAFESAIRTVCEPIFQRNVQDISFAELFLRLLETAKSFNMVILPQLVLLQKTLMNVEGLSRFLDPHLDIWETARPCLTKWFKQRSGPKALLKQMRNASSSMQYLIQLPELATRALQTIAQPQQNPLSQVDQLRAADKCKKSYLPFAAGFISASVIALSYGLFFY